MTAATLSGRVGRRAARGAATVLRNWLLFAILVVVWEFAARAGGSKFFPPPTEIAVAAAKLWFTGPASQLFLTDTVFVNVVPSLGRMLGGWALAAVAGIVLGVLIGRSARALDYVGPLFAFFRSIPPPTLIPVFGVLFGLSSGMQIGSIIFGAVWPVLLNSVDGARSVDQVKVETARSFRTPRGYWLGMVVLPAAAPKIFAGLRVSLSISLLLMVISELVGAYHGIGRSLMDAQQNFEFPTMWSWLVLLGILGYVFNMIFLAAERRVLAWQPTRLGRD
ncbi:ABC transporter permease [Amycolatopsis balhimycina DSM 5908]|uniref:ABC transporter permease n=1 Tax=Amycolatopsis balhimycina DSM 5908 TaxID=1081091 RepID=A0A428WIV8_AMYBA|nr:ABC transporter permease [Amycolatopsis balhimycina]RSM43034.1 ABC transporter permease [Amycolatopsis balhimycina DSM 5908]